MNRSTRFSLASIYFTFFIDTLCWAIVFPIFAPYFLDVENAVLPADYSVEARTGILGLFLMAFPLGQFIGAPILGGYADRYGRRTILLISIFFATIGLGLNAWGMQKGLLVLIFIARLVTGLFASNMSLCLAAVADLSDTESQKTKRFGYLSMFAGLSFILGAFLGGRLSDPEVHEWFSAHFPLWIATGLTALNFLFLWLYFKETAPLPRNEQSVEVFESVHLIQAALRSSKLKLIYTTYFFFLIAWTMLFQFTPALVVERYAFSNSDIGDLSLFMGICWMAGSSVVNKFFIHRFSTFRILEVCLFSFTVLCAAFTMPFDLWISLVIVGLCVTLSGLAWPVCLGVISDLAPKNLQGKTLGISQSVQSLAMTIAPLAGGLGSHFGLGAPFWMGAVSSLIAGGVYFTFKRR